jgi:dihydropteroate synthase-like protein
MTSPPPTSHDTILFVTGRLAEHGLREVVTGIANQLGFRFEIAVPGIQVAALLHTSLLIKRLTVPARVTRVVLPGWCQGDVAELQQHFGKPFELGPRDLYDLPEYFGLSKRRAADLSRYSVEILAEINHATRMPLTDIIREARAMTEAGANLIDVGGVPGETSPRIAEIVTALRGEGMRVSIDSFDRAEVEQAVNAGAELILSCNYSNTDWVTSLGVEVVAIPDEPHDLDSLDRLIQQLRAIGAKFRVDPIIEPIGMGFTASLQRYMLVREKYPDVPMMMGIGNISELTEVDSAGVNMILAAVCEELGIQSVLTTQVINWCRSSIAEFDAARRLMHHAVTARTIPKHLSSSLVMLRDSRLKPKSMESLTQLAAALTDPNFRVFADAGELHLMNRHGHWHGDDVFRLFEQASANSGLAKPEPLDASHAFYLGYELARAEIALHLGKQYTQDEPLQWGLLGPTRASSTAALHGDESGRPK